MRRRPARARRADRLEEQREDLQSLARLAGVAPSTRQSGNTKAVTFRWGADKQLRDALCDFADDSRHANPWAADRYR
jgi:transposase